MKKQNLKTELIEQEDFIIDDEFRESVIESIISESIKNAKSKDDMNSVSRMLLIYHFLVAYKTIKKIFEIRRDIEWWTPSIIVNLKKVYEFSIEDADSFHRVGQVIKAIHKQPLQTAISTAEVWTPNSKAANKKEAFLIIGVNRIGDYKGIRIDIERDKNGHIILGEEYSHDKETKEMKKFLDGYNMNLKAPVIKNNFQFGKV